MSMALPSSVITVINPGPVIKFSTPRIPTSVPSFCTARAAMDPAVWLCICIFKPSNVTITHWPVMISPAAKGWLLCLTIDFAPKPLKLTVDGPVFEEFAWNQYVVPAEYAARAGDRAHAYALMVPLSWHQKGALIRVAVAGCAVPSPLR